MAGICVLLLIACSGSSNTATLYRNSPLGTATRVHWATFDARESDPNYNMNNCLMAARLLNANMTASAAQAGQMRSPGVGFWCEPGSFREHGSSPTTFPEAYPTDT
jgi:hypothetical protein